MNDFLSRSIYTLAIAALLLLGLELPADRAENLLQAFVPTAQSELPLLESGETLTDQCACRTSAENWLHAKSWRVGMFPNTWLTIDTLERSNQTLNSTAPLIPLCDLAQHRQSGVLTI